MDLVRAYHLSSDTSMALHDRDGNAASGMCVLLAWPIPLEDCGPLHFFFSPIMSQLSPLHQCCLPWLTSATSSEKPALTIHTTASFIFAMSDPGFSAHSQVKTAVNATDQMRSEPTQVTYCILSPCFIGLLYAVALFLRRRGPSTPVPFNIAVISSSGLFIFQG